MTCVPAELALLALRQEGIHITPSTLRTWTQRGHIVRTADGYDLASIADYVARRCEQRSNARPVVSPPCSIDDCGLPSKARGLCIKHYRRLRRHGDPHHERQVGYAAVHKRLRTTRGNADTHPCNHCPAQAAEWAYDHSDPTPEHDPRNGPYSRDLDRYVPLCRSCHRLLDRTHRTAS